MIFYAYERAHSHVRTIAETVCAVWMLLLLVFAMAVCVLVMVATNRTVVTELMSVMQMTTMYIFGMTFVSVGVIYVMYACVINCGRLLHSRHEHSVLKKTEPPV